MQPNFFNQNAGRSFPFLADFQEVLEEIEDSLSAARVWGMQNLPNDTVVDFGCTFGVGIDYDASAHIVYLHTIRRSGSNFVFDFRTITTGLDADEHVLRFIHAVANTTYETSYATVGTVAAEAESISRCDRSSIADWGGYLTTGSLESLAELLTQDGDVLRGDIIRAIVEQGLVRSLRGAALKNVYLGNVERTRTTNPEGCIEQTWPFARETVYVSPVCISGPIRFIEGYNITIEQRTGNNSLTFAATVGGGAGEPPAEVPILANEAAADGRTLLTGGPACHEVVRSINGSGGRVLEVFAGAGCNVLAEPENHRLIVDFNMNNMALCYDGEDVDESLCSESLVPSPYCGEAT